MDYPGFKPVVAGRNLNGLMFFASRCGGSLERKYVDHQEAYVQGSGLAAVPVHSAARRSG
jgi:hypothetical protein